MASQIQGSREKMTRRTTHPNAIGGRGERIDGGQSLRVWAGRARRKGLPNERQPESDRESRQTRPDRNRPLQRKVSPGQPVAEQSNTKRNCPRRRDTESQQAGKAESAQHSNWRRHHASSSRGAGSNPNGTRLRRRAGWQRQSGAACDAAIGGQVRRNS